MKRFNLILIFFIFITPYLRAEEITLSLDEAVAIALRDNRDIALKSEDVLKARAKIKEAYSPFYPSLSFTGGWTYTRSLYPKNKGEISTHPGLKQIIYQGGKTINTIKYNEYGLDIAETLLDKAKLETIFNVQKAFYTLILTGEFVNLNKGIVENTRHHIRYVRERYKFGQASESEVLNIESSLANVQEAYEASLNQNEAGSALLNSLLYLDKDVLIIPEGEFTYDPQEVVYDQAFLKAMQARPEIKQYEAEVKMKEKAIEINKANTRPTIYASWDYYSSSLGQLSFSPSKGWSDYNVIGITFSWPIFDGWATRHKVEQAVVELKQAQLLKQKTTNDIALELKNAYLSLKDAIIKLVAVESDLKYYSDNLKSAEAQYKKGIVSLLDLNDANLKYEISGFNKKSAVYDYIVAKSGFDKATGGM